MSTPEAAETKDLLKSLDEAGSSNSRQCDKSRECDTSLCLSLGSYRDEQRSRLPVHLEHLLTKVLRVSDTDKLNRLLIPKKDAERCFPIVKSGGSSSNEQDKFLVLTFYDENGKAWPFKYTHWGSSESNVFTTGWISYVKENALSPGDSVSFFKDSVNYYIRHRKKLNTGSDQSTSRSTASISSSYEVSQLFRYSCVHESLLLVYTKTSLPWKAPLICSPRNHDVELPK